MVFAASKHLVEVGGVGHCHGEKEPLTGTSYHRAGLARATVTLVSTGLARCVITRCH